MLIGIGFLTTVITACLGIAMLRIVEPGPNERTLTIHGLYDEAGHLLTALVLAVGLRALQLPIPIWSVLAGGILLDVGHILIQLDFSEPITGSSRNGTHSLVIVAVVACAGFIDQRRANLWLGFALGALSHLWRDMGTGSVPLLWPISDQVWATSFTRYLLGLLAMALVMVGSGTLIAIHEHASRSHNRESA
jgi:membrane-bound metal-dependent hydrolase YbcI (DUF457 family)